MMGDVCSSHAYDYLMLMIILSYLMLILSYLIYLMLSLCRIIRWKVYITTQDFVNEGVV